MRPPPRGNMAELALAVTQASSDRRSDDRAQHSPRPSAPPTAADALGHRAPTLGRCRHVASRGSSQHRRRRRLTRPQVRRADWLPGVVLGCGLAAGENLVEAAQMLRRQAELKAGRALSNWSRVRGPMIGAVTAGR